MFLFCQRKHLWQPQRLCFCFGCICFFCFCFCCFCFCSDTSFCCFCFCILSVVSVSQSLPFSLILIHSQSNGKASEAICFCFAKENIHGSHRWFSISPVISLILIHSQSNGQASEAICFCFAKETFMAAEIMFLFLILFLFLFI